MLHPDPSQPATVHAAALPWDPSPAAGVYRKRIERTGDEVARLTSLVRYAPGSRFPEHVHGGGEEYLVLDGTFSDAGGDHGVGSYVRNGVGSAHAPWTDDGCVILVKLWWMHADERSSHVVDTRTARWQPVPEGERLVVHAGDHDHTELWRLSEGAALDLPGGFELFVIDGTLVAEGETLDAWTWMRRPAPQPVQVCATAAATVYVKRDHLATPPPLPG
ncbi:MAG: cupin [Deltaproteobacteria bacterium]|nr:MAG: cupin [Deltaproteobacteria bacterium]